MEIARYPNSWFISWKLRQGMMWGYPHDVGNLHSKTVFWFLMVFQWLALLVAQTVK